LESTTSVYDLKRRGGAITTQFCSEDELATTKKLATKFKCLVTGKKPFQLQQFPHQSKVHGNAKILENKSGTWIEVIATLSNLSSISFNIWCGQRK